MSRRFTTSRQDPRILSQPAHQIARTHPSRREHAHGRIQPADDVRGYLTPARIAATLLLAGLAWGVAAGFAAILT